MCFFFFNDAAPTEISPLPLPAPLPLPPPPPPAPALSRRSALLGLGAAFTLGRASLALAGAPTDRRLVVVILRGAMDGLAAVVPYGDPALAGLRAPLVPGRPGEPGGLLDLGGFFGLHPALAGLHGLYGAGELLPVHAVAGHYRTRSHFEGQDCLESGADQRMTSGWLNRVVANLPPAATPAGEALSVGVSVPMLLRGPAPIGAYVPGSLGQPQPELYARLLDLHRVDPVTGPAIAAGLRERGFSEVVLRTPEAAPVPAGAFVTLAGAAGRLLAAPDGPRIAALELDGWDTHEAQSARMTAPLRQLDAGLLALRTALGDAWRHTAVLTMTEFGRTARVNGTGGTDHGTGTVAFLAGGAVAGGRVLADWPGLGSGRLLEDRDLAPTVDLRALARGLLASHLGLSPVALARVFPGSEGVGAVSQVLRG